MAEKKFRSGFVAILGRPNVGKSSIMNRIVGEKVAIVSNHPQTTRNKLLGVATVTNFAVIAANGFRMPVTPLIYEYPELYSFEERIQAGELPEYVLVDWDAPLWFLGDTLPLFGGLASVGDLLMAAGVILIISGCMKNPAPASKGDQHSILT